MDRRRGAGGIFLLVIGGVLLAEALGPYSAVSLEFSVSLALVAVVSAIGGIFLLQMATRPSSEDGQGLAEKIEDPHRPPPIRSPILPVTASRVGYGPLGGGVTFPEPEGDEEKRDESD